MLCYSRVGVRVTRNVHRCASIYQWRRIIYAMTLLCPLQMWHETKTYAEQERFYIARYNIRTPEDRQRMHETMRRVKKAGPYTFTEVSFTLAMTVVMGTIGFKL